MKEISLKEKKEIQIGILKEIDLFCRDNQIDYYLTGGSLLGAVRHNGFIPWDDDIDICLFRRDYEKLAAFFVSLSGNVEIIDYKNRKNYIWSFAKAIDKRTILIELNNKKSQIGVFVDIFPLDNVAGDLEQAKKYVRKSWLWRDLLTLKHLRIEKDRSLGKNILVLFGKALFLIPDTLLIRKIEKCSMRFNDRECRYVCNFMGAWKTREITEKANFSSGIRHVFEGEQFMIPIGYHKYLTGVYKDYMTPPPKEKQVTHHDSTEYWKE